MDFKKILKEVVEGVEGGYAATVMGMDGIAVQDYIKEGASCDIESLGVEYGKVMAEIRRASELLELGEVEEVVISLERNRVVMRPVGKDYFLALVLMREGNMGKGRYLLRRVATTIREDLLA